MKLSNNKNMSRVRIYIPEIAHRDIVSITDRETLHKMRDVLRLKEKKTLFAFDGKGSEFVCQVVEAKKTSLTLHRREKSRGTGEPRCTVTLAFPILREDKIDIILQKGTELGASTLSPFISSRSIQEIPSPAKTARWRKIIIEAARQSERLWLPELSSVCPIDEIAQQESALKIVAMQKGERLEPQLDTGQATILIVSGPEGDFSPEEEALLKTNNFVPISLSKNILRAETASIVIMGLVHYHILLD